MRKAASTRKCKNCGKPILAKTESKKYCNAKCRFQYWDMLNPRYKKGTTQH